MSELFRLSQVAQKLGPNPIRELLKLSNAKDVISFAGGFPSPELFEYEWLTEAVRRVGEKYPNSLGYDVTEGHPDLRQAIVDHVYAPKGIKVNPENIVVTIGAQQALFLLGLTLINKGNSIIVEEPTFLGALSAFNIFEPQILGVQMNEKGMVPGRLEYLLKGKESDGKLSKFIYTIPDFQNPSGITTDMGIRRRIIGLAKKFNVPIIEDSPYGDLEFEKQEREYFLKMAPELVIHLGTFSKMPGIPGLRIGWMIVPDQEFKTKIVRAIQATNLCPPRFNELVITELLNMEVLDKLRNKAIPFYKQKRDFTIQCLENYMPSGVKWTNPKGGLFIWITLPEVASENLFQKVAHKLIFVPGEPFLGQYNELRFNYSYPTLEQIEEGIKFMAQELKKLLRC
jgi:2-aminoadipate transaminase